MRIKALVLAGVVLAGGWAAWLAVRAETVPPEPTDQQLLKLVDPAQPTDFVVLRAALVPTQKVFFTGQPLLVDFQLLNTSDRPILVRVPFQSAAGEAPGAHRVAGGLPLDHVFTRKAPIDGGAGRRALVINPYNEPIIELDDNVVYNPPGPVEPVLMRPYGQVGRRLDLAQLYPSLTRPGRFIVQWRPYGDALRSLTVEIRVMHQERAVIETDIGNIELVFFYDKAPNHVENFLDLARRGFYNQTLFHRVVEDFLIHGGDPLTADRSRLEQWGAGRGPRTLSQEFNDTVFAPGIVGAARGPDVNSASSQFFIVTGVAASLDGQYTAFGRLADTESLKVAARISKVRRDPNTNRPIDPVVIRQVRVFRVGPSSQPASDSDR